MRLLRLSHVNIRTRRLAELVTFYENVLGLQLGERPPFSFNGAWLYCAGQPVIHLVEVDAEPQPGDELRLQHFAFDGVDLNDCLRRLEQLEIPHRVGELAGWGNPQVHLADPDGNHLHLDFPAS